MKKERMITRTVKQTTADVMCVGINTCEVTINTYTIGGRFDNDTELLSELKAIYETAEIKLVHINSKSESELLLGMLEEDFIRLAKVLPPRGTKATEE